MATSDITITDSSPFCDALCALLAAREAALRMETLLEVDTIDRLMHEIGCTIDELLELHERSAMPTEALVAKLRRPA